jgi:hypothetical protein
MIIIIIRLWPSWYDELFFRVATLLTYTSYSNRFNVVGKRKKKVHMKGVFCCAHGILTYIMENLSNFESVDVADFLHSFVTLSFPFLLRKLELYKTSVDLTLTQYSYHFIVSHHNVIINFWCTSWIWPGRMKAENQRSRHCCQGSYDGWSHAPKLGTICWNCYLAQRQVRKSYDGWSSSSSLFNDAFSTSQTI